MFFMNEAGRSGNYKPAFNNHLRFFGSYFSEAKDFLYDAEKNIYTCPQGHELTARESPTHSNGRKVYIYRTQSSSCKNCPLQAQCLTEKVRYKKIQRWEHQDIIDEHKERMRKSPGIMRQRGALVEHPFGTLKHRAGMHHFLMRSLKKCSGEFSLMVLAYNFTRVVTFRFILGGLLRPILPETSRPISLSSRF